MMLTVVAVDGHRVTAIAKSGKETWLYLLDCTEDLKIITTIKV